MPEVDLTNSPHGERKLQNNEEPQIQAEFSGANDPTSYVLSKGGEAASARGSYDFLNRNGSFNIEDLRAGRSVSIDQRRHTSDAIKEYEESGSQVLVVGKEVSENSSLI